MADEMSDPAGPNRTDLIRNAADFAAAFEVSRETIDRLAIYERLLREWQKTINLVAASTLDAVWHRHFADSAQLLALAPQARAWVDLGSGAGFPGLVVAVLMADSPGRSVASRLAGEGQGGIAPSPRLRGAPPPRKTPPAVRATLIESNARKCAFLREVVRQTGVGASVAVDILSTRIEAAATQARVHGPDVVSARALAPLDRLVNLAAHLSTSRTVGLFLKGRDAAAELEAARRMWNFDAELVPSRTEPGASIVVVRNLRARSEGHSKGTNP
jgi:16S rRNA (guanine527-N7)-methyltransferase